MGNASSVTRKNDRGKIWKKLKLGNNYKEKNHFNKIEDTLNIKNLNMINSVSKSLSSSDNDDNVLDNWEQAAEIENVISPQNVASQVVSLVRESINNQDDNVIKTEEPNISSIEEILEKYSKISTVNCVNNEIPEIIEVLETNTTPNEKKYVETNEKTKKCPKHKKELEQSQQKNSTSVNTISQKGILKKEDEIDDELAEKMYLVGDFSSGDDERSLHNKNFNSDEQFELNQEQPLSIPTRHKNYLQFNGNKRKKCVRFNDKVVIVYYASAENQQRSTKNGGTFFASAEEPLKVALQQQQRNRELRNKFAYTHTVFPTAIRVGKS